MKTYYARRQLGSLLLSGNSPELKPEVILIKDNGPCIKKSFGHLRSNFKEFLCFSQTLTAPCHGTLTETRYRVSLPQIFFSSLLEDGIYPSGFYGDNTRSWLRVE